MSRSRNAVSFLCTLLAIGIIEINAKPPRRIQGGRLATESEFGAAVTLSRPDDYVHMCGAAIIGPRHIVTAAHCVDKRHSNDIIVRAGIHDIRDYSNVVERLVSQVFIHSEYLSYIEDERDVQNDIAILVLKDALPIGGRIQKLMLPVHQPEKGVSFLVAGWGRNSRKQTTYQYELKILNMTLGDDNTCDEFVPKTICAYSNSGSSCSGDSGSPLIRDGFIYGIDSSGGCEIGEPTIFVNVYDYLDWIKNIISNNP